MPGNDEIHKVEDAGAAEEAPPLHPLASLSSLTLGALVFGAGGIVWVVSGGLLFIIALPLMGLGTFLLLFATLVTKHSSSEARVLSGCAFFLAAFLLGSVLLPA